MTQTTTTNTNLVLESIFETCEIKGGKGVVESARIVALYPMATKASFFPDADYLAGLCSHFGIPLEDIYVTPIIKDYEPRLPINEYIEMLIAELAVINPNFAWVMGRSSLETLMIGNPKHYYPYVFGRYFPVLVEGFYGLLIPDSDQVAKIQQVEDSKRVLGQLNDWVSKAMKHYFEVKGSAPKGPQEVPKTLRADLALMNGLARSHDYMYDTKLRTPKSYFALWSPIVQEHIIICTDPQAKERWSKLGFGLVFTQEEVRDLDRKGADFLAQSIKQVGARKATRITKEDLNHGHSAF